MTDWGVENPIDPEIIRDTDIVSGDWYWLNHPTVGFNGPVGIFHFTNGLAAFAVDYIAGRNKAPWFESDGEGGWIQVGMIDNQGRNMLWMLAWCLVHNGFTLRPMNGGQAEYDELVPTESVLIGGEWVIPEELVGEGGGEESMVSESAGESGEEEVTSDG